MLFKKILPMMLLAVTLWAAPVGSIKGYVRDTSGAIVPGAIVTLVNEKTGVQVKTLSDSAGLYQFLELNGRWQLLATSNRFDHPYLFQLAGNPRDPRGWLRWSAGRALLVPQERWNHGRGTTGVSYEHANAAFLVNRGPLHGRYYLIYADASELTSFAGSGHDELALARSTDLRHWSVPPH